MAHNDKKKPLFHAVTKMLHSLQANINNKKIKNKITLVYIFCVLFPVIVTNIVILGISIKASEDDKRDNINKIITSISHEITSSFENASYVTAVLYASSSITNFLEKRYQSPTDYLRAYNNVFDNYVFYSSSKHIVSNSTLYSDNSTMTNGGKYFRIDSISEEEWYREFKIANQDLFVFPYYDSSAYVMNNRRMLSVIRKLNLNGIKEIEKLVKLDLNYDQLNESIRDAAFNAIVYVCHDDKILFTNDRNDKGSIYDFMPTSMIPMEEVQSSLSVVSYGFEFDIYLGGYKSNYNLIIKNTLWLIAVLFLADALVPAVVLSLFSNSITKRILLLGDYLKKVRKEEFEPIPINEEKDEIGELLQDYNLMAIKMNNLIEYEYKSKLEQQELHLARQQAELHALYSQINPHFMFNILETIRMRSVIKNEQETSKMIESLARLMRKSADWGSDMITLEQELGFTEDYLKLQKYRFGDGFNYRIRINKEHYDYMIPSLVLVTFVENSCIHGLNREEHAGSVFISVYQEEAYLIIEIEDTGVGMDQEQVRRLESLLNEADINQLQKASSLGMLNASIRLKKYCGNETKLIIESEIQEGTCIIIKIPIGNILRQKESSK
jgi:two-component system sensor histidine kinase YesM